jgi:hypothetical protein
MSDIDEKIRAALKAEFESDGEAEPPLPAQIAATFMGRTRWLAGGSWIMLAVYGGLAVFAAVRFFQVQAVRDLILYAAAFVACVVATAIVKVWYWMLLNRNSVCREIKRLELRIAELAADLHRQHSASTG